MYYIFIWINKLLESTTDYCECMNEWITIIQFMQNRVFDREVHSRGLRNMKNVPFYFSPLFMLVIYAYLICFKFSPRTLVWILWLWNILFYSCLQIWDTWQDCKAVFSSKLLASRMFFRIYFEMFNFLNLKNVQSCF